MKQTDFSECLFIEKEMKYYTIQDFKKARKGIRHLYRTKLSKAGRYFYKYYVYANIHTSLIQKNYIWEYLNFPDDQCELIFIKCPMDIKP